MNYIDSVILIYYYDYTGPYQARASRWIASFLAAGEMFAISDLVRMECRVKPLRAGDSVSVVAFNRFFSDPTVQIIPMTPAVFDRAAEIRAAYGFKTPDAIHLAAAIEAGCDRFLTHDVRLARFSGIAVGVLP